MTAAGERPVQGNFDVVVVGSGLTGAWASSQLIEHGLSVLLLEAGPALGGAPPPVPLGDEAKANATARQAIQSRHFSYGQHAPTLFVDDVDHPYAAAASDYSWIRGRQLGGRSATWGGVALRFSDLEFQGRHSWPISSSDLAPYYALVERFHRVEGFRDGLDEVPDGEAIPPQRGMTELEVRFRQIVQERWPTRRIINTRVIPRGDDDAQAWSHRSVLRSLLPQAEASGRLCIRADSIVSHLRTSRCGRRVESIACLDRRSHAQFEVPSRLVILCASTIESVRILLNSKSSAHPDGIGNNGGLLGRKLLDKAAVSLSGDVPMSQGMAPWGFNGHGVLIPRFQHREPGCPAEGSFGIAGWMQRASHPETGEASWALTAQIEVQPRADNRIEIDPELRDAWGIPSVRIHFDYSDSEHEQSARAERAMTDMAAAAGYRVRVKAKVAPGIYVHETGGAPMGADPATSVLDRENRVWGVDNLVVADGACFVTSGWQNPSLTMMALAARAARLTAQRVSCTR